jgi:tetratricopeptide (TPR) repeat protein
LVTSRCSTQKNTTISRAYHNLTAHYNVYFNGNESYKKGVYRYDEAFHDDYSRNLPVFTYGKKEIAGTISSDMDLSIKKASKLITLHSIKAKPEIKKGKLSPKEKEFYSKSEYNNWVDNAYLLIGKSNFYLLEYDKASEAFNIVIKDFPKENAAFEAQIWLARTQIEKNEFRDAEKILSALENNKKFPRKLRRDLFTTYAHLALKRDNYEQCIKYLEKALPLTRQKKQKVRYNYILAQLYQQTKKNKDASEKYAKVIKMNPPYEMTFNARINLAGLVQVGSRSNRDIKQQLNKMLRDDKNKDYLDQIYYALGNIEMIEGNTDKAIDFYKKSVTASTINTNQKALSCLTLANYFYDKKNYVPAQAYYDSTMQNIATDYPEIETIKVRAESLGRLVEYLNTIQTEDSLQRVAQMSENQRMQFIDKLINDVRKKESEAQLAESQRLQDYYRQQGRQNLLPDQQNAGKWYFYNPVSVNQGMKDFQLRWGKRKLEDNWRRKNKTESDFAMGTSENFGEEANSEKGEKKSTDNKSREFYLQNLPLTDSLLNLSKKKVLEGYYQAGQVYRFELKDYNQAAELYEEMIKRFPDNDYKLSVYYQLYSMYKETNNPSRSEYYKNILVTQYPNSAFAQVIVNPEYYKTIQEKENEANNFYEQTYQLYQAGNYYQVITNADRAIKQYPKDESLPLFAFLKALSTGKTGDMLAFRNELNSVVEKYQSHEVSAKAKEIIDYLNNYKPETKQQEDIQKAEIIYSENDASSFIFVVVVRKSEDINQLNFDVINFNLDNFANDKLEINNEDLGKEYKLLLVSSFTDKEKADTYYKTFNANNSVLKNVKSDTKATFYITPENFDILIKQNDAGSYIEYFRLHFMQSNPVR